MDLENMLKCALGSEIKLCEFALALITPPAKMLDEDTLAALGIVSTKALVYFCGLEEYDKLSCLELAVCRGILLHSFTFKV